MQPKYLLIVTEPAGWNILDTPRPQSSGAIRRRAEPVGKPIHAYDVLLFEGVPYAYLVPLDPNRPEWGRVSEAGGVIIEDGKLQQLPGVKTYVKVINLQPVESSDSIADAINRLADAVDRLRLK